MNKKIKYIDETPMTNKRVLMRADFDVSLNANYTIADDRRIKNNIPTIQYLLKQNHKVICVAKLGRPKARDPKLSLQIVVNHLKKKLPGVSIRLIDDFLTESSETFQNQKPNELFVLENIRFYPQEKNNDIEFAKKLADLSDIYVNDSFAMCHRTESSVVQVPLLRPSFGGLLLRSEIEMISKSIKKPKRPLVTIIGGSKISTKINLIEKLIETADYVLLGGGLANVFFKAQGFSIGNSLCEYEMVLKARELMYLASQKKTAIILPTDVIVGEPQDTNLHGQVIRIAENSVPRDKAILDIGPETKARFGAIINKAKTIIWNGPIGLFENPAYSHGTDFLYYAIAHNSEATSIIGGGDTLAAITHKEYLKNITHISTGGAAMLGFIEKGTLPGIEALRQ